MKTTASGLKYIVEKEGTGARPGATGEVTVKYTGQFSNGKVFDSSDGKPVSFPVNKVIAGWTEGLQLMREGGKYRLIIPSELAYGSKGIEGLIPPNATLRYDIELIKVKK